MVGLAELGFDLLDFLAQLLETVSRVLSDEDDDEDDDESDDDSDEDEDVDELRWLDFVWFFKLILCCERVETLETLLSSFFGFDNLDFELAEGCNFSRVLPVLNCLSLVII